MNNETTKPNGGSKKDNMDEARVEEVDNLDLTFDVNCMSIDVLSREAAKKKGHYLNKSDANKNVLYSKKSIDENSVKYAVKTISKSNKDKDSVKKKASKEDQTK